MFASPNTSSASRFAVLALLAVPLLVSCGDETKSADIDAGGVTWTDPEAGRRDGAPTITQPKGAAPSDLEIDDLVTGDGAAAEDGSVVVVDYVGANYSNGKVFDASYGRAPFAVTLGAGRVIAGWDQGLVGIKPGGKRQLVIPPDLGYGDQANGDIGANETLIFIIEARAVLSRPDATGVDGGTVPALVTTDLEPGIGDATVQSGSQVSIHYVGVHGDGGQPFDSSWDRGEPIDLQVGSGQVIAGWDQGLVGMRLGGRRRLEIPSSLAYGDEGRPPIRPGETLVFVVDVVGLS